VVHKKDATCNGMGRRVRGDDPAGDSTSGRTFRTFSGFWRLDADSRMFDPVMDEALRAAKEKSVIARCRPLQL
jgi:hypothetical protein